MKNLSPINDDKDVVTKEYVDPIKSQAAVNRTTLGTQCKNLLKNNAVTKTVNGVTFTINDDKSITVNGTATAQISFMINNKVGLGIGNYILTGCPSGGSWNTFYLTAYASSAWLKSPDFGSSCTIENKTVTQVVISIASGYTANNLKFYPMLRHADITDDTYEPYSDNVDTRLTKNKSDIAVIKSTLGYQCKNLLKNTAVSTAYSDVKFTVNSDGTVDVSSIKTSTATRFLVIGTLTLEPGNYVLTGADDLAGYGDIRVYVDSDVYQYNTPFTLSETKTVIVRICVYVNRTLPNTIRVYPMIRYADITDSTYEQYQPSFIDRCLLKDTAGIALGGAQGSSITIDNLSSYTVLWVNVSGNVAGINFKTNLIVPIAYLAKSTSNSVQLAGGIPSSAYITSEGVLAAKYMDGTITAKVSGNTLDLTIGTGTIGSIEVVSLM